MNKKPYIALIEDERILSDLLIKKLERSGFEVTAYDNGIKGYEGIKNRRPDLLLLDMMVPGLNGLEVAKKLHEEGILPSLPVIIVSNSARPAEVNESMSLGVRDFLVKIDFDPDEVLTKIRKTLNIEEEQPAVPTSETSKGTILIVEDDTLLADLLSKKFKTRGFFTKHANLVSEAKAILENSKVDIILLDLILPVVDGFTFLKELKETDRWKSIPVMIVSNLGQAEEVKRGLALGAIDFLVKAAVSPLAIVDRVEEFLKKHAS